MGVPGACISGVGLPAFDIVLGYWSQVVRLPGAEPDAIRARGSEAGWIMTIVGVGFIVGFSTMIICCECEKYGARSRVCRATDVQGERQ